MRVGIVGAGAIGCAVGGRLARGGAHVVLVGRDWVAERLARGVVLSRWGEDPVTAPAERIRVATDVGAVADCDVVLVATKSRDTAEVGRSLAGVLRPGIPVGSLQNGVRNPGVLAAALPDRPIWPGVVVFNVVWAGDRLHQGTTGDIVLPLGAAEVVAALVAGGAPARTHGDVPAVQWAKLVLNLNNAINALSGLPLRAMLAQRGYRRILAGVISEGLDTLRAAGVRVRGVGRLRPGLAPWLLRLPDAVFFRAAAPMIRIDPEARSSMSEDLARGRTTEVDELNGEIAARGPAPLNAGLVRLIRAAEAEGPRAMSADELAAALR